MLRNAPDDIGIFAQEFLVSLLWSIPYPGQKQLLIGMETVYQLFFVLLPEQGIMLYEAEEIIPLDDLHFRRFYAFQEEKAGRTFVQTVEGSYKISFEEKLESNVLSLMIEKQSQAATAHQVEFACNLAFFQENGLGRYGQMSCL